MSIPITDNHIHVNPIGDLGPVKTATLFNRSGGTTMFIPNLPAWDLNPTEPYNHKKAMQITIDAVEKINKETPVQAFAVLGIHPIAFDKMIENGYSIKKAREIMFENLELAKTYVLDQKAVAIGEIGRPHYSVNDEIWDEHNKIMEYSLNLASDIDCPVQLHMEEANSNTYNELHKLSKKTKISSYKIIKHYANSEVLPDETKGITSSVNSSKELIKEVLDKTHSHNIKPQFLMETDYMDNPKYPGRVLGPRTVPRRTIDYIKKGLMSEEDAYLIHKENIEKIYGVDLNN
ncbi:TatD family hydrolase [Methanosphaera sp.]